jgi:hypothetical protein
LLFDVGFSSRQSALTCSPQSKPLVHCSPPGAFNPFAYDVFLAQSAAELHCDGAGEVRQAELMGLGDDCRRLFDRHRLASTARRRKFRVREDLRKLAARRVAEPLAVLHCNPEHLQAPIRPPRVGKLAILVGAPPILEPAPDVVRCHRVDASLANGRANDRQHPIVAWPGRRPDSPIGAILVGLEAVVNFFRRTGQNGSFGVDPL